MSSWAHINGVIRIRHMLYEAFDSKGLREVHERNCQWVRRIFGPQSDNAIDVESEMDIEATATIPMGSEGTIHWRCTPLSSAFPDFEQGRTGTINRYLYDGFFIEFGGDLRDIEPEEGPAMVREWFTSVLDQLGEYFLIRQATCELDMDYRDEKTIFSAEMDYVSSKKDKIYEASIIK